MVSSQACSCTPLHHISLPGAAFIGPCWIDRPCQSCTPFSRCLSTPIFQSNLKTVLQLIHPIYADFSIFSISMSLSVHVLSPSRRDSASALSANTVLSRVLRRCSCILSALGTLPSVSLSSSNGSSKYNPLRVRTLLSTTYIKFLNRGPW